MAMLRTLRWFTEILIGSLFAQLCDHAVQQFWAHQGGLQAQFFAPEAPWIVRQGRYNPRAEEVRAELRSAVSEADALLGEFQHRGSSFCGCVRLLLCGREYASSSGEELVARTRAVRRRLRELAGADGDVVGFAIERRHEVERANDGFFRWPSQEPRRREKGSVLGIAGVALTYVWWVGWIYNKSREIPRFSLVPSSLLEYLNVHFG